MLPLESDVRGKEVKCKMTSSDVAVSVRGAELLVGQFFLPIKPDDSTWEIEAAPGGGKQLRLGFAKAKANKPWDCLFLDEVDDTITHRCFMDISIGGVEAGRIVYGLYGNACPKTVENFRCLCTGEKGSIKLSKKVSVLLHYKGCAFSRVVPGFICQGGDVTRDPGGRSGASIYGGGVFDDENFKIKHTGAGQLLSANFGQYNNNHSQFAIAMSYIKEFESKHVIFGKVLEGMEVLRAMEFHGSGEGFTSKPVIIEECGELDEQGQPIEELRRDDDEAGAGADGGDDELVLEEQ